MAAWTPYLLEWGSMLLRWLHVTAAIAWIGASFFFMHLDAVLRKEAKMTTGVAGVSWQVHGGGFYEMSKYTLAPALAARSSDLAQVAVLLDLDLRLQAFVLGLLRPVELFLIDPAVMPLHPWQAAAAGSRRSRSAGSSTTSSAARRSPTTTRCWRWSASASSSLTSYALHAGLLRPRRADPHRRADGDDDDRQRLLRHHAQSAQVGRALIAGRDARAEMGQDLQAAFDAQQLHHAARAVHDAVEPLSGDLRQFERRFPSS